MHLTISSQRKPRVQDQPTRKTQWVEEQWWRIKTKVIPSDNCYIFLNRQLKPCYYITCLSSTRGRGQLLYLWLKPPHQKKLTTIRTWWWITSPQLLSIALTSSFLRDTQSIKDILGRSLDKIYQPITSCRHLAWPLPIPFQ